jgi:hypothetical protein
VWAHHLDRARKLTLHLEVPRGPSVSQGFLELDTFPSDCWRFRLAGARELCGIRRDKAISARMLLTQINFADW